jgi:hypothetical protein
MIVGVFLLGVIVGIHAGVVIMLLATCRVYPKV